MSNLPQPALPENQARTWAAFAHLAAFIGLLLPFGNIIGPLIIWLIKRNESPLVDDQGREALNFQISMSIYAFLSWLLTFILIGFLLLGILVIFWLIVVIVAAVKASDGQQFRYPLNLRFIK
jgi:uncharacterized Tic20 family protein